ncbi:carbohydrate-binding family 9-like protein [Lutibacter flavus]|uniref:Carbohydrate family 9 binding domain-like n=1 Tax=Lutibacter flavus TaxID=691689 RepID=A0A238YTK9_9FLAO|nr:carbohydrate-binding family 9-like protein [Lutibacter flavus]SNR74616.1 Carbohydrate family 9 binding domain-like [Lutibacter flavus]
MKNYNVKCIEKDTLTITGNGVNSIWNKAEVLTDFVSPWDKKEPEKIEFRAIWDTKNLFFCFTVYDKMVHIDEKDDSVDSIGNSDRVELFFRTDKSLNPYYCLEIDPVPRIMDFMAYPNKNFNFNWSWPKNDLIVKSQISCNNFTVEIAISIASLRNLNLINGNKIEAGIFRAKYNEQENSIYEPTWISWVNLNTETPNFHTPSSFGVLNLMEQ